MSAFMEIEKCCKCGGSADYLFWGDDIPSFEKTENNLQPKAYFCKRHAPIEWPKEPMTIDDVKKGILESDYKAVEINGLTYVETEAIFDAIQAKEHVGYDSLNIWVTGGIPVQCPDLMQRYPIIQEYIDSKKEGK